MNPGLLNLCHDYLMLSLNKKMSLHMFTYSYWFSLYYIIVIIVIYRCFVLSSFFVCVFSRCVISFGFLAYPQIAKAWHRTVSK